MKEIRVSLSDPGLSLLTSRIVERTSVVVTMGVAVERSVLDLSSRKRGKRLADWGIGPQCKSVEEVRAIRDEIEGRVTQATAKESKIPH